MLHNFFWQWFMSTFLQIVIFAGIVQGFFLALVLTTKKNKNRKSNRMLAVLLIFISVSILHNVFASGITHGPYRIKEPLILLMGPLLLFYVRGFTGVKPFGTKDFFHFVPFLVLFFIGLPEFIMGWSSAYSDILQRKPVAIGIWALIVGQYGFYWWKVVKMLRIHTATVKSEFSDIEGKTLSWMRTFLHVFGMLFILFAGTVVFAVHNSQYSVVDAIVSFGLSCVVFVLGYEGLFQGKIFSNVLAAEAGKEIESGEVLKTEMNSELQNRLSERLIVFFEGKKPYLDEGLTLTKLAGQLGMTRNQLSSVINTKFGNNFYSFVNKYRVDEVKRLIADPKNKDFTILSLAYQAGFPSKSSFHDIFKKFTGMTPTEYQSKVKP